tara:strand:- start:481 stop:915 length:435 start_codon:yes stop_codon:yes gene_type:complete
MAKWIIFKGDRVFRCKPTDAAKDAENLESDMTAKTVSDADYLDVIKRKKNATLVNNQVNLETLTSSEITGSEAKQAIEDVISLYKRHIDYNLNPSNLSEQRVIDWQEALNTISIPENPTIAENSSPIEWLYFQEGFPEVSDLEY